MDKKRLQHFPYTWNVLMKCVPEKVAPTIPCWEAGRNGSHLDGILRRMERELIFISEDVFLLLYISVSTFLSFTKLEARNMIEPSWSTFKDRNQVMGLDDIEFY